MTTDVYMAVFDKFIADNKLSKERIGLHNYQNEISRPMCKIDSCWDANLDKKVDDLASNVRRPGTQLMTFNTLEELYRNKQV